ncbi:MAG: efflux RND transporter periplasmic adaptor subunit, partial [Candidatus Eisenbacteria bacterium]
MRRRRNRTASITFMSAALALALLLALSLCSCQGKGGRSGKGKAAGKDSSAVAAKKNGNGDAIPIEVAPVARNSVSAYVTATSTLEAERTAELLSETTGRVVAILREEGDRVDKGTVLMRLEDTQQKLDFEKAKIDLEVAEKNWERAGELEKREIVSKKEFDEARLQWEAAKHSKARADYELEKTRVVAPFAGVVTLRNVQLGETVTPGKHVATVADFDPLVVKFHVPESELGPVKVGQPVIVELPSTSGNPTSSTLRAGVNLVSPIIDEGTGTIKLTSYLKNPGLKIRPCTFVRARVIADTHENAVTIPKKALLREDGSNYVF